MGAISWNIITWGLGIPSSSSDALIGGLIGAGFAKAGFSAIVWKGVLKTAAAIILSPALGLVLALVLVLIVAWLFVRSTPLVADRRFRKLQLVSASLYSLGHGGNDAQKRSEEHTSELQSLMRISYAVFCLKKKKLQ